MPKLIPILNRILVTPIDLPKPTKVYIPAEFKDPEARSVEGARRARRCQVLEVGPGGWDFDQSGKYRQVPVSTIKKGDVIICYNAAPIILEKGELELYKQYKDKDGAQLPLYLVTDLDVLCKEAPEK